MRTYESKKNSKKCFLISSTVFHKGFPDDCKELTTLRNLRENLMKSEPQFSQLISQYEIIPPKILININAAPNKDEILDSTYNHLVLPAVALVRSGKDFEAIDYYRDFVGVMKNLCLSKQHWPY